MNKAIFLDRDGTINVDFGYVYKTQELELLPGVAEALRIFQELGYLLYCHHEPIRHWTWLLYAGGRLNSSTGHSPKSWKNMELY